MSRVLDRLEDGGAIEIRFQNALNKIRTTLRMASDGDDTLDIMQIQSLYRHRSEHATCISISLPVF